MKYEIMNTPTSSSRRSSKRQGVDESHLPTSAGYKVNNYHSNWQKFNDSSSNGNGSNNIHSPIKSSLLCKLCFLRLRKTAIQVLLIGLCLGVTLGIFIPISDLDGVDKVDCSGHNNGKSIKLANNQQQQQFFSNNLQFMKNVGHQQGENLRRNNVNNRNKLYKNDSRNSGIVVESAIEKEKMKRPRYFSTELGLRSKIIVGIILTDLNYIDTLLAINQTLSTSRIDKLLFFVSGSESSNVVTKLKTLGLLGIIELNSVGGRGTTRRKIRNLVYSANSSSSRVVGGNDKGAYNYNRICMEAVKYLGEKFGDTFDYFFISSDIYYINGRHLVNSVSQISVSQDVLWGVPAAFSCSLEKGFIISRKIVQKLAARMDQCLSSSGINLSNNFGKCIYFLLGGKLSCENSIDGLNYSSVHKASPREKLTTAITIGPVQSSMDIFEIHGQIFEARHYEIQETIKYLQNKIKSLYPKIPTKHQKPTWPLGIPRASIPKSRFDVLKWTFFDQNFLYGATEVKALKKIDGIDQEDFRHAINSTLAFIRQSSTSPSQFQFQNGYRRFDPTRGMEYILDFHVTGLNPQEENNSQMKDGARGIVTSHYDNHGHSIIRIEGVRPLCRMELISVPFVTDSHRTVTIIVPVTTESTQEIHKFLDRFFDFSTDHKLNSVLLLALIVKKSHANSVATIKTKKNSIKLNYNENPKNLSSSSTSSLTPDQIQEIKNLLAYYNRKTPSHLSDSLKAGYIVIPTANPVSSSSVLLSTIDGVIKRIVGTSALILTVDSTVNIKDEFLNRVRMNTVMNHQVFSPIPFMEYNPMVYNREKIKAQGVPNADNIEINRNSGYFDENIFRYFSFFAADYVAARKSVNSSILMELQNVSDFSALEHIFIRCSSLHILRSPEPSLKIPFSPFPSGCSDFEKCAKTNWGSRAHLAKIIFTLF